MLFTDNSLFLTSQERKPWIPKAKRPRANVCIPQLRQFAGELAFLNLAVGYCDMTNAVLVYAGSSLGGHMSTLASFFPQLPFHLYDPRDGQVQSSAQITVHKQYFTNKTAQEWAHSSKTIIFISDIRAVGNTGDAYEVGIGLDMAAQAKWVEIIKPAWWSLKFRIPYPIVEKGEPYSYLGGWLMMQPFAEALSMEMRLIGTETHAQAGAQAAAYDTRFLEEVLFHHNTVVRPKRDLFLNVHTQDETEYTEAGFARGYDVTYLLHVLEQYLGKTPTLEWVNEVIQKISKGEWSLAEPANATRSKTRSRLLPSQ